ncbi:DUF2243 domain-containing protein [Streptomyces sp. NPDC029674]|uniref:DUF2243 domain-containing protein n=1 Tax=Streptomyces sp. NPDC029674 TaxID=3365297 RepID=UPI003850C7E0
MNASARPHPAAPGTRPEPRRSMVVCGLLGVAVMAAVDEIVFHQILHWHHFYDRSTTGMGLMSDGLLHTGELLGLVAGFFLYADLRRRRSLSPSHALAGFFLGLGIFQLYDGIVDHKLLRLHQVRYGVDVTPYDWAWNLAGLVLLLTGVALAVRAARVGRTDSGSGSGSAS